MSTSKTETPQILDEATQKRLLKRARYVDRQRELAGVPKKNKTDEEIIREAEEAYKRGMDIFRLDY